MINFVVNVIRVQIVHMMVDHLLAILLGNLSMVIQHFCKCIHYFHPDISAVDFDLVAFYNLWSTNSKLYLK